MAVLSPNYTASKVCQEEFNLARALSEDPNYSILLLPVKISDISSWPVWCQTEFLVDCVNSEATSLHAQHIIGIIEAETGKWCLYEEYLMQLVLAVIVTVQVALNVSTSWTLAGPGLRHYRKPSLVRSICK